MKPIETVQQFYKYFGAGDLNGVLSLLDENILWELIGPSTIPYFGVYKGQSGVKGFFDLLFKNEKVIEFMPEEFIDGGDRVCVLGREKCASLTTGRAFETQWIHIFWCKENKINKWREYINTAPMVEAYH